MELIKLKDLVETQGMLVCPHCWNANKIMVFATYHDLQVHVRKGCLTYRYRKGD